MKTFVIFNDGRTAVDPEKVVAVLRFTETRSAIHFSEGGEEIYVDGTVSEVIERLSRGQK